MVPVPACNLCPLHETATNIKIPSRGSDKPMVVFVGEAPTKTDDWRGQCFSSKSAKYLDDLLKRVEFPTELCRWTNLVRCLPCDYNTGDLRKPSDEEINVCIPYLYSEFFLRDPAVIVTLGNTVLHALVPKAPQITKARRTKYVIELPPYQFLFNKAVKLIKLQNLDIPIPASVTAKSLVQFIRLCIDSGLNIQMPKSYIVYPTFHPAAASRGNLDIENGMIEDLSYVKSIITGQSLNDEQGYDIALSLDEVQLFYDRVRHLYLSDKIDCVSIDLETTGLDAYEPGKVLLWSISYGKGQSFTVPFDHKDSPFHDDSVSLKAIVNMTNDFLATVPIVNHNIKFDLHWLYKIGIRPAKVVGDSYHASWTIFNDTIFERSLDALSSRYVGMINHKDEMKQALRDLIATGQPNPTMDDLDIDLVHRYCCADADAAKRLHHKFEEMMASKDLLEPHRMIAIPAIIPITNMECDGIRLDTAMLESASVEYEIKLRSTYDYLNNLGYGDQLVQRMNEVKVEKAASKGKELRRLPYESFGYEKQKLQLNLTDAAKSCLFFDILGLPVLKMTGTGKSSSDKEVIGILIEKLQAKLAADPDDEHSRKIYDVVVAVRDYGVDKKTFTSYILSIPKHMKSDRRVHTHINIRTTKTGRCTCNSPSLHVMPWKSVIKKAFIPLHDDGLIVSADYSQMELRVGASLADDAMMIALFHSGADIHRNISAEILHKPPEEVLDAERRRIKMIVFGIFYGRGAQAVAAQERIPLDEAQALIDQFFSTFSGIDKWIKSQHKIGRSGIVKSPFGFTRILTDEYDDGARNRRAVNTPVQGGASDTALIGITDLYNAIQKTRMRSTLFGFVHDSVLSSIYPGELWDYCSLCRKMMQERLDRKLDWLKVPLKIDFEIGTSWGELSHAEVNEDRTVKFEKSSPELFEKLSARFASWPNPPELLDSTETVALEDGSEMFLTRSAVATREAHKVTAVDSVWKFPPYDSTR